MEQPTFGVCSFESYISFQIFDLLPVRKASQIPYEVEDPVECLHVRPRRYILPYPRPDNTDDAHSVFQVLPAQKVIYNIKNILIYLVIIH